MKDFLSRTRVIILTYNAERWAPLQLLALRRAGILGRSLLVIDSSSKDSTRNLYSDYGAEVIAIAQQDFDHGTTRQLAAELAGDVEFLVYLTQDAIPANEGSIKLLLSAFVDPQIAMAYGRQLPRPEAGPIESHARLFNYPPISRTVRLTDRRSLGGKVTFASDSFAAYRKSSLRAIGGFPANTFFAEDQIVAARLLQHGLAKAYIAEAQVYHSHAYGSLEEFRRYFDVGVFHARNPWLLSSFGRPEGEGKRFVLSEQRHLLVNRPWLMPLAALRTAMKYTGYRAGLLEARWPVAWKRRMSASPYYWK